MPKLTDSVQISGMQLKSRMIMAPMGAHNGNLGEAGLAYYKARIDGGAAMLMLNIMVTGRFEDTSASITLTEENVGRFKELCDYAHARDARICAQLMPGCGRIAGPCPDYGVPISASACGWLYAPDVPCHELTLDEIKLILDAYRSTAELAVKAGADAIEIHAYGGYLTDQFLTSAWNTRTDEYGGDLRGRMKFLLDMITISRTVGGRNFPVIVKYCPSHYLPEEYGFRGMKEGLEMSRILVESGVNALHVDAGCYENWYYSMPSVYFQEMTPQIKSAKLVRSAVSVPVITHGRLSNIEKAQAALDNEVCDIVAIGRGLLADPELPLKVAEGRLDDVRPCISCNDGCIAEVCEGRAVSCSVNPLCGKESERSIVPTAAPKRILVVGAGPGGCAAAIMAGESGHEVEVWEKSSLLGGKALAASMPYMKRDMSTLMDYYRTRLVRLGIRVRYFKEATVQSVGEFAPEHIIWAAGGAPLLPRSIEGLDRPFVYQADLALKNLADVGENVAVVGGGLVGIETAVHFAKLGKKITVVEMADTILPQPPFAMNKMQLEGLLAASGAEVLVKTKLVAVRDFGIEVSDESGERLIACDTVLMALGFTPTSKAAAELEAICPVSVIGDAKAARNIMAAVDEAYEVIAGL